MTMSSDASTEGTILEKGSVGSDQETSNHWLLRYFSRSASLRRPDDNESDDGWSPETQALDPASQGYDQLAIFQSSDRNFLQYRGFRTLHCRVLSSLQYEIEGLESDLQELDDHDRNDSKAGRRMLSSLRVDTQKSESAMEDQRYEDHITQTRPSLLRELRTKLLEYDEMLLRTREVMALPFPAKRDYNSVLNFLRQNSGIIQSEACYIRRKEDIVTLRAGRESAGLDGVVELCLIRLDKIFQEKFGSNCIQRMFLTPELRAKSRDGKVKYFSASRIDALVNLIITSVVFILLVLPVVVMYEVTSIGRSQTPLDAIGILIVFTLVFGVAVSTLTTARRHELFAASAAYAAVLVVFIGNFGVQTVSILPSGS